MVAQLSIRLCINNFVSSHIAIVVMLTHIAEITIQFKCHDIKQVCMHHVAPPSSLLPVSVATFCWSVVALRDIVKLTLKCKHE